MWCGVCLPACLRRRDGAVAVRGVVPVCILLAHRGPCAVLGQLPAPGSAQGTRWGAGWEWEGRREGPKGDIEGKVRGGRYEAEATAPPCLGGLWDGVVGCGLWVEFTLRYDVDEHLLTPAAVAAKFETSIEGGLSFAVAAERRAAYGPNRLTPPKQMPEWAKFLKQFTNPLMVGVAASWWGRVGSSSLSGTPPLAAQQVHSLCAAPLSPKAVRHPRHPPPWQAMWPCTAAASSARRHNGLRPIARLSLGLGDQRGGLTLATTRTTIAPCREHRSTFRRQSMPHPPLPPAAYYCIRRRRPAGQPSSSALSMRPP